MSLAGTIVIPCNIVLDRGPSAPMGSFGGQKSVKVKGAYSSSWDPPVSSDAASRQISLAFVELLQVRVSYSMLDQCIILAK